MKSLSKLISFYFSYYKELAFFVFGLLFCAWILLEYFIFLHANSVSIDEKIATQLTQAVLTLSATLLGIVTPIILERRRHIEQKKRDLLFALTSCWVELRAARDLLKDWDANYLDFADTLEAGDLTFDKKIDLINLKFTFLSAFAERVTFVFYQNLISNNLLAYIPTDELYNGICQAYEDLEHLTSLYFVTKSGMTLRLESIKRSPEQFEGTGYDIKVIQDIEKSLKQVYSEIKNSQRKTEATLPMIENYVKIYGKGAKVEEEDKEISTLLELPHRNNGS